MARALITLAWLPMLLYPFVVLADVMALGGDLRGDKTTLAIAHAFLYGTLLYPLIFFPCRSLAKHLLTSQQNQDAARVSIIPILYVLVMIVLALLWGYTGG